MQELREQFEAYGGDYQTTMSRFMGNEAMYLKFLNMFFRDDSLQKLGEALESGNYTGAFEAAHTLKGVSANLGLTPLYQAVCAIVEPLRAKREDSDFAGLYRDIQLQAQRVRELRNSLCPPQQ